MHGLWTSQSFNALRPLELSTVNLFAFPTAQPEPGDSVKNVEAISKEKVEER